MSTSRRITAIIPVYNRRTMIVDAVSSVLDQEVPAGHALHLIVVDDGSTDGTRELLTTLAEHESRMTVLLTGHCGRPGAVRNRGVDAADGDVIAFLDSDDRWLPGKLLRQVPLHAGHCRISHTRERWLRAGCEVSQRRLRHQRWGDIFADSLRKCIIGPSTVVIDRELLLETGGFREDLEVAEDYELWLRITAREQVAYVDHPLTEKRAGDWDQLSTRHPQIEGFRIDALRPLVYEHRLGQRHGDAAAELVRKLRIHARGARRRGRLEEAEALLREADALAREVDASAGDRGVGW